MTSRRPARRRAFIGTSAAVAVAACRPGWTAPGPEGSPAPQGELAASLPGTPSPGRAGAPAATGATLFGLGVASGDPLPDGVVLWTRLAPEPARGGWMPPQEVAVHWQLAADEQLRQVLREGVQTASPEWAHSVHVEVSGLEPDRWYWFRFRVGDDLSPVGRTRTAPPPEATNSRLRLAIASCQNWQDGYFTAHRYLSQEELDLVIHLGDYIYEGGVRSDAVRAHDGPTPLTVEGYRRRYALYKSDADLQAAHAAFPWVVTWDDHEVADDYAGQLPEGGGSAEVFLRRRAAAYRAYYEHQPLRFAARPSGADLPLYRQVPLGRLLTLLVLDTRQYRDLQPACPEEERQNGYCPAALDPQRTILGEAQRRWLLEALDHSPARWNVLAQQVVFAQHDNRPGPDRSFGGDKWDGYVADRRAILDFIAQRRPSNVVVLTGDQHQNRVYEVKGDFDDPSSETLAVEFVGTSISAGGDVSPATTYSLPENPHQRFRNTNRGYVRCEVTPDRWQADYRVVSSVRSRTASISTLDSFVVEAGRPGVRRVT
jgi:alkaline phosphatase D